MRKITLRSPECTIRQIEPTDRIAAWMIYNVETHFDERMARQAAGEIEYVGAFIRRRVVGHVVLMLSGVEEYDPYTEGGRCAAASDLHVVEAARGIGVGTALMQFLEERCLARGVAYLALDVNPSDSTTALELYKRLGFEQVSPLHLDGTYNVVDDDGNPSIYEDWCIGMVKRLSPAGR